MKSFLIFASALLTCQFCIGQSAAIQKITVYAVSKGAERYMQINESNIRQAATNKFEVTDSVKLTRIESSIKSLKKIAVNSQVQAIYMLCEVVYRDGGRKLLSFEDRENGYIKSSVSLYENLKGLEGMILFLN